MRNRQLIHRGMTLVELLVVAAIIGLLLAVSVPILKPMLDSRRTSNAAQVLAGVFQQARAKSIQEGKSYGVRLIPFETAPTAAVQLITQKGEPPPDFTNPINVRVRVKEGGIIPYYFATDPLTNESGWVQADNWNHNPDVERARDHFLLGYAVQFNHLGRFFVIEQDGDGFRLKPPDDIDDFYENLHLPDTDAISDAMQYRIARLSFPASWLPPAVMPHGTIVDIVFSGGETRGFGGGDKTQDGVPAYFESGDEVVVMFSPMGHVDMLCVVRGAERLEVRVNEMLYFCVGEWDRQINASTNATFAEDGKSNLEMPSTFWVTLHPKTGGVRITENAPAGSGSDIEKLRNARKFAREHFFNVGGN